MSTHKRKSLLARLLIWRIRHISNRNFMLIMAVLVGVAVGLAAVIIKNGVYFTRTLLTKGFSADYFNYLFFIYPAIGIGLVIILLHRILKIRVGHGIPTILHAISSRKGVVKPHNLFSSVITSTLTVGFGGSVGLEGPTVATGGAIGSNLGQLLHLSYRQIILLIGCAAAGAMSAIFKAPIAAIVFVLEVVMLDLTLSSLVPLLLSSVTAALTSYLFLGQDVLYQVKLIDPFEMKQVPLFILLGVFSGFVSVYFSRMMVWSSELFDKIRKQWMRWLAGGFSLGVLIFFFPALYGEGYEAINAGLNNHFGFLFEKSPFAEFENQTLAVFLILVALLLFKVLATGLTFGAGGIGGIFAPCLFTGMVSGVLFAMTYNELFFTDVSVTSFALVAMGGIIAGVLHAPLTAIFLIAEITMAYNLFVPLMITSAISYATTRYFQPLSVYHYQLARRKQLFTHDKDKVVLSLMKVDKLIENNFDTVKLDATLGDLIRVISVSRRNIYPVVDDEMTFYGMVILDDVRSIIFNQEKYEDTFVRNLMVKPKYTIDPDDTVEDVAQKFHQSGKFNIPVIHHGKYKGFISRARLFSSYRQLLKKWSED